MNLKTQDELKIEKEYIHSLSDKELDEQIENLDRRIELRKIIINYNLNQNILL